MDAAYVEDEEKARTQVILFERQRDWAKLVAQLATWRIQNDPVYGVEDTSRVSMAEVIRMVMDQKIWGLGRTYREGVRANQSNDIPDLGEGFFHPSGRPDSAQRLDLGGRGKEIERAMEDVALYGEDGTETPMQEIPDNRRDELPERQPEPKS
jgi:hypothetical protein